MKPDWRWAALLIALPSTALGEADVAGRGGTRVAALTGPSAVHHNPANLSRMFSLGATVGGAAILAPQSGLALLPHVYAGYGNGRMGLALGVNAPVDSVLAGHLGGAWQLTPQLSVGVNGSLLRSTESDGAFGLGGGAGVSWAPDERLRFALAGRLPSLSVPARLGGGAAVYLEALRLFADLAMQRRDEVYTTDLRLGLEKDFGPTTVVRAGLFFDRETTEADRIGLSLGAGRDLGVVEADLAYQVALTGPAQRRELVHLVALTLSVATPPGVARRSADASSADEAIP